MSIIKHYGNVNNIFIKSFVNWLVLMNYNVLKHKQFNIIVYLKNYHVIHNMHK